VLDEGQSAECPCPSAVAHAATREATLADIDNIENITLEDFAVDFSRVKLPEEGPLTEGEMTQAVASFGTILREG
jgi:hypothetical protein